MEPGVLARWAHHGAVGLGVVQQLGAEQALGAGLWVAVHCLLWAVVRAEGSAGKSKGLGEVCGAEPCPGAEEDGRGGLEELQSWASAGCACAWLGPEAQQLGFWCARGGQEGH